MRWYFDYISPYAYLQSTALDGIRAKSEVEIECVPVLFAGLLRHWDNVGPAEIVPKRDWTFRHIAWLAHRDNIPLKMPSHHPFNPLPLLRLGIVFNNELAVVQRLFRFVWVDGHVPQDELAFNQLLDEFNLKSEDLQRPEVKAALSLNGQRAAADGVFGVPSFKAGESLFWGYDAADMLQAYLSKTNWPEQAMLAASALPEGPGRQR